MDIEAARAYAVNRLTNHLPTVYLYHAVEHTRDDVVPTALAIGRTLELDKEELILLETAAWFHDIGFIYSTGGHERNSCIIASAVLSQFNYSPSEITQINSMITATTIPQAPPDRLAAILCDADLHVLGRADFPEQNAKLRQESVSLGSSMSDAKWFSSQWAFAVEHEYHTRYAREAWHAYKVENIDYLLEQMAGQMETFE